MLEHGMVGPSGETIQAPEYINAKRQRAARFREEMEELVLTGRRFPVLNDGFVQVIDYMGTDVAVVNTARLTAGTLQKVQNDRGLLRYLLRNRHSTPFEFCQIVLHVRVPMDAWRQWVRHRMASINEYSTRYSPAIDSRQTVEPDAWRQQSKANRQGSSGLVEDWPVATEIVLAMPDARIEFTRVGSGWAVGDRSARIPGAVNGVVKELPEGSIDYARYAGHTVRAQGDENLTPGLFLTRLESEFHGTADALYKLRLDFDVAKEVARKDLPLSTYTEAYWRTDLHNLMHFLGLRMDPHAQQEIRAYADIIGREIVSRWCPLAWEAFEDFRLGAKSLTRLDREALTAAGVEAVENALQSMTKRERDELLMKAEEFRGVAEDRVIFLNERVHEIAAGE